MDDHSAPACRTADLVLLGGTVHAFDGTAPAQALAIGDGLVQQVGSDEQIRALVGSHTRVVHLAGRTVLPGINESHLHATWLGLMWPRTLMGPDLPAEPSTGPGLRDGAERRAAILRATRLAASMGITSITEPGLGPGEDDGATGAFGTSVLREYQRLAGAGELPVRVTTLALFGELDGVSTWSDFADGLEALTPVGADPRRLCRPGVKIFADGIPPMGTAYTDLPYRNGSRPELLVAPTGSAGREEALRAMVMAAHRSDRQVAVHATGERSIQLVLDAVAEARADHDVDLRHYIVHGDLVTPQQLHQMAELGVGLNIQPGIALRTFSMVDAALGEGTAARAWPLAEAMAAGVRMCLSSDAPILSPDWREHVAAADAWMGPATDVRARMASLLRAYTVFPALQDGAEDWKGTLTPGKVADLCVLDRDPLDLTPAELPAVEVDLTLVGGSPAFERAGEPRTQVSS